MAPERKSSPQEKGKLLCNELAKLTSFTFPQLTIVQPEMFGQTITLVDEYHVPGQWDKFVQFPKELSGLFPGSYVSPDLFLNTLGKTEGKKVSTKKIMSTEMGTADEPVFTFKENGDYFSLRVMNGMANKHALTMSRLAQEVSDKKKYEKGFASENAAAIRAEYQDAMVHNIGQELFRTRDLKQMPAVRIHDDCLASGDSIISYLYDRMRDSGEYEKMKERGVNVVIDEAATAQGILYLQAFANSFDIHIELTAGHMAFGLTAGVREKEDAPLQHANYITYPPQSDKTFYQALGTAERTQIKSFGEMGAVAGDMGEAERGIEEEVMDKLRKEHGDPYCPWNEVRTDSHGDHKLSREGIKLQRKWGKNVTDYVYFARGGFLPWVFDQMTNLDEMTEAADMANIVILRLSRLNVIGGEAGPLGYGAGFAKADCVTYL